MQLKSTAKLSTVIGFITKHADCRMHLDYSQYVCYVFLLFEFDQNKNSAEVDIAPAFGEITTACNVGQA